MPSNRERLHDLSQRYGLGPVSYSHSSLQSGKFIATVLVGRRTFPSYPAELESPTAAEEECARQAVEYYRKWFEEQSAGNTRVQLPETTDIALMTERVLDIVRPHPVAGCWVSSVMVKYSRVHEEKLPEDWIKLVTQFSKELEFTRMVGGISVRCPASSTLEQNESAASSTNASRSTHLPPARPRRKPVPDTWLVHVLAISTGDRVNLSPFFVNGCELCNANNHFVLQISVRRIDTADYDEWETMAAEMDSFFRNHKGPPMTSVEQLEPGLLYAALIDACWLRVAFIDHQDDDKVNKPSS